MQPITPHASERITITPLPELARQGAPAREEGAFWGKDGFSFGDFLDLINPLQHIPVVSTIYRAVTGDAVSPGARIFGGALFGGVVGLVFGAANAAAAENTGKDFGEHALALFTDDTAPVEVAGLPWLEGQEMAAAAEGTEVEGLPWLQDGVSAYSQTQNLSGNVSDSHFSTLA